MRSGLVADVGKAFTLGLAWACSAGSPADRPSVTADIEKNGRVISLSHSLNSIARGETTYDVLEPSIEVSGDQLGVGSIADARAIDTNRIAVLDRIGKQLLQVDSAGALILRLGREGKGPGEFSDPLAIVSVGEFIVVWQSSSTATFVGFDTTGHHYRTVSRPIEGDWRNLHFRSPVLYTHDLQQGPEDVTRRFRATGDTAFLHMIQPDEHMRSPAAKTFDLAAPPAHVVRYSAKTLTVLDTVEMLDGPPLTLGSTVPGALPDYWQELFAARPVFAAGEGWIAFGHGDSTIVNVTHSGTTTTVMWPKDSRPIDEADRMAAVKWTLEAGLRRNSEFAKEWSKSSKRLKNAAINEQLTRWLRFADRTPSITTMFGSGNCLFLSGFSSEDFVDGSARTYLVLHLANGVLGTLRIGGAGEYVHEVTPHLALTTRRDKRGEWFLRVYRLPFHPECSAGSV